MYIERLTTELDMEFTRFLKENPYESYSYLQGARRGSNALVGSMCEAAM